MAHKATSHLGSHTTSGISDMHPTADTEIHDSEAKYEKHSENKAKIVNRGTPLLPGVFPKTNATQPLGMATVGPVETG